MRVLHVLDHSLPFHSGYSFRSQAIARAQQQLGLTPFVITSHRQETLLGSSPQAREVIDGVEHHRVRWAGSKRLPVDLARPVPLRALTSLLLAREVTRRALRLRVDLLHAHSPSSVGLATGLAASRLGLPWIYELRYYEEDAAVARGKTREGSPRYRLARRFEETVLRRADAVVTISAALRRDLAARGVAPAKLYEVPNGVDTSFFHPRRPDPALVAQLGLANKTVVGYIGSLFGYEGLDLLIDAMLPVLRERDDLALLLVGVGEHEASLQTRIPDALRERSVLAGRIEHEQVPRYYSVLDLLVYPRTRSRLTELTTPLKPLEAMAMERVVVGSDIGGLRDLIQHEQTGFLVEPGNVGALRECLGKLLDDVPKRQAIGKQARAAVLQTRTWVAVAQRYLPIYRSLVGGNRAPISRSLGASGNDPEHQQ